MRYGEQATEGTGEAKGVGIGHGSSISSRLMVDVSVNIRFHRNLINQEIQFLINIIEKMKESANSWHYGSSTLGSLHSGFQSPLLT